jgi:hypothetical protein
VVAALRAKSDRRVEPDGGRVARPHIEREPGEPLPHPALEVLAQDRPAVSASECVGQYADPAQVEVVRGGLGQQLAAEAQPGEQRGPPLGSRRGDRRHRIVPAARRELSRSERDEAADRLRPFDEQDGPPGEHLRRRAAHPLLERPRRGGGASEQPVGVRLRGGMDPWEGERDLGNA